MACFIRRLIDELLAPFLTMSNKDVANWYTAIGAFGCTLLGESDYKDQFSKAHPDKVVKHMEEADKMVGTPFEVVCKGTGVVGS